MVNVIEYALGVLLFVAVLAFSIGLHEVGHLLPAKKFGVRVTQYMIGFGPTLWSRRKGETEYGVKGIPLGGYVAMIGMFPPAEARGENAQALRGSSTGMFQTLVDNARQAESDRIGVGDENRVFYKLPAWKKITVMLGGPIMNILLGTLLLGTLVVAIGNPAKAEPTTTIGAIYECIAPAGSTKTSCEPSDPKSPAAAAGLKPGDTVVSVNGRDVQSWDAVREIIRESPGQTLALGVRRGAETLSLDLTPKLTPVPTYEDGEVVRGADGKIVTEEVGFVGVATKSETTPGTLLDVPVVVGETIAQTVRAILALPMRLVDVAEAAFSSAPRDPEGPIGVVGIGRITGEVTSMDEFSMKDKVSLLLGVMGSLNIFLAVFNLVPMLPFDGGHIAGAIWESIRRGIAKLRGAEDPGPVDVAKGLPVAYAVASLLIVMSVLLLYADIVKPISLRG